MANREDIKLFFEGVKKWNERAGKSDLTPPHRPYRASLAGSEIGIELLDRVWRGEASLTAKETLSYAGINFNSCDLRRTSFQLLSGYGFDFSKASFESASLQAANLTGVNLTKATFLNADLNNAVLRNANLDSARLEHPTNLIGADLSAARPWRAHLYQQRSPIIGRRTLLSTRIESVADVVTICLDLLEPSRDDTDKFTRIIHGTC